MALFNKSSGEEKEETPNPHKIRVVVPEVLSSMSVKKKPPKKKKT